MFWIPALTLLHLTLLQGDSTVKAPQAAHATQATHVAQGVVRFEYKGAGILDHPIRYPLLRQDTVDKTMERVIDLALNQLQTPVKSRKLQVKEDGNRYICDTDYATVKKPLFDAYASKHNGAGLESDADWGIRYHIESVVGDEQYSVEIRATLGNRAAGGGSYKDLAHSPYDEAFFASYLIGSIQAIFNSGVFDKGDFLNAPALVHAIVTRSTPLAAAMYDLGGSRITALQTADSSHNMSDDAWKLLVDLLNRMVYGDPIYDPKLFAHVNIPATLLKQAQKKETNGSGAINRQLLVCAFPQFISPPGKFPYL